MTNETNNNNRKPTVHDPVTFSMAYYLDGDGRARAEGGYVCYALVGAPTNSAGSHPGQGPTERAALLDACYWANQAPWIRVVPVKRAPRWVLDVLG